MPPYSDPQIPNVCRQLGRSWIDLADYFAIPSAVQSGFPPGDEGRALGDWLDTDGRLAELADALHYIGRDDLLIRLIAAGPLSLPSQPPQWTAAPYPGLRPFTAAEAPIFCGREAEIRDVLARLADPTVRQVAVIGGAGGGKSSLVAAGVIPRLHEIPGGDNWLWTRFTPGAAGGDPFLALAAALEPWLETRGWHAGAIADRLRLRGELGEFIQPILENRPMDAHLLLFIDQFEDLFSRSVITHRRRFLALLVRAAATAGVRILLTLRADFFGHCLTDAGFSALLRRGTLPLPVPAWPALFDMIVRPAALAGLYFDDDLPARILEDAGRSPGTLAALAAALAELFEARERDGRLTHPAYEHLQGVAGAVARRAEAVFNALAPATQAATDSLFQSLIEVDENGLALRRRPSLEQVTDSATAQGLVTALTQARLLVTERAVDETVVVLAHDALMEHWPLLRHWLEDQREDLRLRRRVQIDAAEWERRGCREADRWPAERLLSLRLRLRRLQPHLSPAEQAFVISEFEHLLDEIASPTTPHSRRLAVGDRLSRIGDTRPGVGLRADGLPDLAWCPVPGGGITLKGGKGGGGNFFYLKPFYIAKYHITWWQYRVFLEAFDGYGNPVWWEGLALRTQRPGEQKWKLDNRPAENVSWFDAVAYCRWLSAHLGYEIRLPTEWEWQQAATGNNTANDYPWGSAWDGSRANTVESGLKQTAAVGMYPGGAAPVGALDMSGNVWEWCLNEYDQPTRVSVAGDARRVVRGGSWNFNWSDAQANYRNRMIPGLRLDLVGLRVVCMSPV